MYLRQAASDFAICHVHDRFFFTVGSLFGTPYVAALRMPLGVPKLFTCWN